METYLANAEKLRPCGGGKVSGLRDVGIRLVGMC